MNQENQNQKSYLLVKKHPALESTMPPALHSLILKPMTPSLLKLHNLMMLPTTRSNSHNSSPTMPNLDLSNPKRNSRRLSSHRWMWGPTSLRGFARRTIRTRPRRREWGSAQRRGRIDRSWIRELFARVPNGCRRDEFRRRIGNSYVRQTARTPIRTPRNRGRISQLQSIQTSQNRLGTRTPRRPSPGNRKRQIRRTRFSRQTLQPSIHNSKPIHTAQSPTPLGR